MQGQAAPFALEDKLGFHKENKEPDKKLKSNLILANLESWHPITHPTHNFHLTCISSAFSMHIVTVLMRIRGSEVCC